MRLRYSGLLLLSALISTDERLRNLLMQPKKPNGTKIYKKKGKNLFYEILEIFKETTIIQQSWVMCRLSEALGEQQDPNDQDARLVFLQE